jgi:hypothetical protein
VMCDCVHRLAVRGWAGSGVGADDILGARTIAGRRQAAMEIMNSGIPADGSLSAMVGGLTVESLRQSGMMPQARAPLPLLCTCTGTPSTALHLHGHPFHCFALARAPLSAALHLHETVSLLLIVRSCWHSYECCFCAGTLCRVVCTDVYVCTYTPAHANAPYMHTHA